MKSFIIVLCLTLNISPCEGTIWPSELDVLSETLLLHVISSLNGRTVAISELLHGLAGQVSRMCIKHNGRGDLRQGDVYRAVPCGEIRLHGNSSTSNEVKYHLYTSPLYQINVTVTRLHLHAGLFDCRQESLDLSKLIGDDRRFGSIFCGLFPPVTFVSKHVRADVVYRRDSDLWPRSGDFILEYQIAKSQQGYRLVDKHVRKFHPVATTHLPVAHNPRQIPMTYSIVTNVLFTLSLHLVARRFQYPWAVYDGVLERGELEPLVQCRGNNREDCDNTFTSTSFRMLAIMPLMPPVASSRIYYRSVRMRVPPETRTTKGRVRYRYDDSWCQRTEGAIFCSKLYVTESGFTEITFNDVHVPDDVGTGCQYSAFVIASYMRAHWYVSRAKTYVSFDVDILNQYQPVVKLCRTTQNGRIIPRSYTTSSNDTFIIYYSFLTDKFAGLSEDFYLDMRFTPTQCQGLLLTCSGQTLAPTPHRYTHVTWRPKTQHKSDFKRSECDLRAFYSHVETCYRKGEDKNVTITVAKFIEAPCVVVQVLRTDIGSSRCTVVISDHPRGMGLTEVSRPVYEYERNSDCSAVTLTSNTDRTYSIRGINAQCLFVRTEAGLDCQDLADTSWLGLSLELILWQWQFLDIYISLYDN